MQPNGDIKMNCEDLTEVSSGNPWCYFLQLKAEQEFFNTLMAYKLKIAQDI